MNNAYFACLTALVLLACGNRGDDGEQLAKRHCSTCHAFVEPHLLDKKTWQLSVMPEMAFRMGLDVSRLSNIPEEDLQTVVASLPKKNLVSESEWRMIAEYFSKTAPDTLVRETITNYETLVQFTPAVTALPVIKNTLLTMIRYDQDNKEFFIGNRKGKLYRLTSSLTLKDSVQLDSPPSEMIFEKGAHPLLTCMGIMDPNDRAVGSVIRLNTVANVPVTLIDSLKRPVHFEKADLNNDNQEDLVVSAFGNFTGALFAYEKTDDSYRQHIIHNFSGTRKTIVRDFNDDGLPDILALITQGDEQIALFTNRGRFRFSYQILLKFPAVYGSSYMDLYDFNNDGHPDILYTNGDNADYSSVLKPYHGVRIFINDGKNKFNESWFHPLFGASMAKAADFDKDGDLDIAAISFFPDFNKSPEKGFVYFENDRGSFIPFVTKLSALGRWITLETSDFDGDEDIDIVLASLTFPNGVPDSLVQTWKNNPASLLILKNKLQ